MLIKNYGRIIMNETKEAKMFVAALLTNAFVNVKLIKAASQTERDKQFVKLNTLSSDEDIQTSVWKTFQKYLNDLNKD